MSAAALGLACALKQRFAAVDRIVESPFTWPVVEDPVRRYLIRDFPYGVHYTYDSEVVRIAAVAALMREPGYWRMRR